MKPLHLHPVVVSAAALFVALFAQAPARAGEPQLAPLDAVVHYETEQTTTLGVLRIERWSERFVRRVDTVWNERIRKVAAVRANQEHPSDAASKTSAESVEYKHFDHESAGRLVERDARGGLTLRLLDAGRRLDVSVPAAEYSAVGLDGRWEAAAHLVPPSLVAGLKPLLGEAPARAPAGSRWLVQKSGAWTYKVLWSEPLQVAQRIESVRDDGSFRRSVRLELQASTAAPRLPWSGVSAYERREHDDFLD